MASQRCRTAPSLLDQPVYYEANSTRDGKNRLLILVLALFVFSCAPQEDAVRLVFVGDVLLSRNVKDEYSTRKTFPWDSLEPYFSSADLVIGNLEGAVGRVEEQIQPQIQAPVFAIDSSDIALLAQAGFSAMTIENNHSLDLGRAGKVRTASTLFNHQLKSISFENSPTFFTIKETVISLVTLNLVLSRDSSKYALPTVEASQKMRLAKAASNVVIVSIHWGSELLEWPNKEQRNAAAWLVANGADVIIGHHPHVIQKPELVDGKPVYFSLGNHLFDQKYARTKIGMMADIELKGGKLYCRGVLTQNRQNSFYPEIKTPTESYFEPVAYRQQEFVVNGVTIIPENIDRVNKIILGGYIDKKRIWTSHPMSLTAIQTITIDRDQDHLFTLESYYSTIDKEINIRPYVYAVNTKGLTARWRGSALAWPTVDAQILPSNTRVLCALHRGDSFIKLEKTATTRKVAAYTWNGFGFSFAIDTVSVQACERVFH